MDNMDLSTFQLVDAINDMDMLRNLSGQQEQYIRHQQQQQQQQQHTPSTNADYTQLQGDTMALFFPSDPFLPYKNNNNRSNQIMPSPHYRQTPTSVPQNDCFDHHQEDIFTPLISPAMTPSFTHQVQQQQQQQHQGKSLGFSNNDMDFSPLSSPAILPQVDRHQKRATFHDQMITDSPVNGAPNDNGSDAHESMSANQIYEQYEQLEHAKLIITQKLSELQKSQSQQQHKYSDGGYQRSLLSSSDSSSSSMSKSSTSSMHQQQMKSNNSDQIPNHRPGVVSRPSSPSQSPHMEPATPASLMNLKVTGSTSSKLQFSSSTRGNVQQFYPKVPITKPLTPTSNSSTSMGYSSAPTSTATSHVFQSPIMNTSPSYDNNMTMSSPMMTPTTAPMMTSQPAPPSPLTLHPRKSSVRSSSLKNEKSSRYSGKKQRRESSDTAKGANGVHASPRALKPLLISPTLNPGIKPLPNSIIPTSNRGLSSTGRVDSVEDAERILATRSNYQNLMEGKGAALGIAFSTQIKSGLEVRRTAHKAAEQKRRDSLKEWFDRLRCEVEDGYVKRQKTLMSQVIKAQELEKNIHKKTNNTTVTSTSTTGGEDEEMEDIATVDSSAMKPLSKVLLLQYAFEYISSLKSTLDERDATIAKLTADKCSGEGNSKLDGEPSLKRRHQFVEHEDEAEYTDMSNKRSSDNDGPSEILDGYNVL